MNKKMVKNLISYLVIVFLLVSNTIPIQAATKTTLKTNAKNDSIYLTVGKSKKVKVTSNKKFTYELTDKKIATVTRKGNTLTVKGKKYGACGLYLKAGNKKLLLNISVKNKSSNSNTQIKEDPNKLTEERCYKVVEVVNKESKDVGNVYLPENTKVEYGGQGVYYLHTKTSLKMDGSYSDIELYNYVALNGGSNYFYSYFAGFKNGKAEFYTYNYTHPTQLSFNDTTFRTGETCGVLSVLNRVPGSSYTWSTDNPSVVGIEQLEDKARVKILANTQGSANVSCVVIYPMGEKITLTSKVNVSDTAGSSLVDMNYIMRELPSKMEEMGYDYLPNYLTKEEIAWYGFDGSCNGGVGNPQESTKQYKENLFSDLQILEKTTEEFYLELQNSLSGLKQLYVEYSGIKDNGYYIFGQYGNDSWRSGIVPYNSEW